VGKKYKTIISILLIVTSIIFGYTTFEGETINKSEFSIELIEVYQDYLSGKVPFVTCKYQPTCSEHAKKAIEEYGFRKGIVLSFKRICSCI